MLGASRGLIDVESLRIASPPLRNGRYSLGGGGVMDFNHRGFACIGLDNPKTAANVGAVMRIAYNYNAAFVAIKGRRYKNVATDTTKGYRHIPTMSCEDLRGLIPHDCIPVAVDLLPDAVPLPDYVHPERAFYIFGAEDATLGERVTSWCPHRIYVPTTRCMNLAVTVGVVLYDRLSKQKNQKAGQVVVEL
jgi:tRNA(Leu) C34 or U34 (ribose-2'-O)-methylase TrmL